MQKQFIHWYIDEGFKKFLAIWKRLLFFTVWYFSITLLLRTLFSPWRRNIAFKDWRGLRPFKFISNLIWNTFSRVVGAIVRSGVIIVGIFLSILMFLGGLLFMFVYIFAPFLLIISLILFLTSFLFYGLVSLFLTLGITFFVLVVYLTTDKHKDYFKMNLWELHQQKWFKRVYKRFNIKGEFIKEDTLKDKFLLQSFLKHYDVTVVEFEKIVKWEIAQQIKKENNSYLFSIEKLLRQQPIGLHWHFGYTVYLDKYADDLTKIAFKKFANIPFYGLEEHLHNLEVVLTRPNENCAVIVGLPGVGRSTLVTQLAWRIRSGYYNNSFLRYMRVLRCDLKAVIAEVQNSGGNAESVIRSLFMEAGYAGNIILVIDNLEQYLDPRYVREFSFSALLDEYAPLQSFRMIGLSSKEKFYEDVNRDAILMRHFSLISVEEMGEEAVLKILMTRFANLKNIFFTYQAFRQIIANANRYMNVGPLPTRAISLTTKFIAFWQKRAKGGMVLAEDINEFVHQETGIPLGKITKAESSKLLSLEKLLHQRIIGQDYAVRVVASVVRRMRSGMVRPNKPAGSFLFLGPTGVGKTEMAKALAEQYFGSENKIIRLDMSEFQGENALGRLIGSKKLKQEGALTTAAQNHPYALLLLDEIEKANSRVLDIFLQILDEGFVHDGFNRKINFSTMIIIATSNASSSLIKEMIEEGAQDEDIKKQVIDAIIKKGIFRPELLNRFDDVVMFHSLKKDDIPKIVKLMLVKFVKRMKTEQHIEVVFDEEVIQKIIENGFEPIFGARSLLRYIDDVVADALARKIITDKIRRGETIQFKKEDLDI